MTREYKGVLPEQVATGFPRGALERNQGADEGIQKRATSSSKKSTDAGEALDNWIKLGELPDRF